MKKKRPASSRPRVSVSSLRARLREAEEALRAIREGEVDAVIVKGARGEQVYSLSGAETIYRLAAETMAEAVLALSPEGRIVFCNPRLAEFLQVPQGSLLGRPLADFVPVADRVQFTQMVEQAKAEPVRRRLVLEAGGRVLPVRVSASPLKQQEGAAVCVVATDLTQVEETVRNLEQVRHEREALREGAERLRGVLAGAAVGFAITAPEGRFVDVNPAFCRIVGYGADELRRLTYRELIHPDDSGENERLARRLEAGEVDSFVVENRCVRKDGTPVWVRESVSQVRDLSGVVQGHVAFVEDISEQKRAGEELRKTSERLRSVMDHSLDVIYRHNVKTGRYEFVSRACESVHGFTPQEMQAMSAEENIARVHPDDQAGLREGLKGVNEEGSGRTEVRWRRKSGEYRWHSIQVSIVRDADGQPQYRDGVVQDITERKRAEQENASQLAELQRWQAVMLDREDRIMELKREINGLLSRLGEPVRYPSQAGEDTETQGHGEGHDRNV